MKKNLIAFNLLLLLCTQSTAQISQGNIIFISDTLNAVSFNKYYPLNLDDDKNFRWTPDLKDIQLAEKIIHDYFLHSCKNNMINQDARNCPVIKDNLTNYFRQYIGILNKNGEKIIEINFIWNDIAKDIGDVYSNWIEVQDGCSKYWSVNVNLKKGKCFNLEINGY